MLFFSIFLSGFTLGIFAALKIFSPENKEESWDPQNLPAKYSSLTRNLASKNKKPEFISQIKFKHNSRLASIK